MRAAGLPTRWYGLAGARDRYSVTFTPDHPGLYWYYFTIDTADGPRYCARGYGGRGEIIDALGDKYQLTVYDPAYQPPGWFGEGITYNIFPDRFCRDRLPVQPEGEGIAPRVLHENWDDIPAYRPDENGEILNNDFFGGTLRGVMQKLDYLESLRVTTIYFNPIFQAYSNHRYDTGDYKRIDPLFGCEEDFRELCREAAARGMRVVLDGVFNHTGFDSRYFNGRGRSTVWARTSLRSRRITAGSIFSSGPISTARGGASTPCRRCGRWMRPIRTIFLKTRTASCAAGCGWGPRAGGWMWRMSCRTSLSGA